MYRALSSFTADGTEVHAGVTRVAADHPLRVRYPDRFTPDSRPPISGERGEIRARGQRVDEALDRAASRVAEREAALLEAARDPARREEGQMIQPRTRDHDRGPGHEHREAALRAIERCPALTPEAGDRLDDLIRRDRTGTDAAYIAAVSEPAYQTAFWKRLADPGSAPHVYTPDEAEATRRVSQAQAERALAEGVGATGGFGVPVDLDPTILFSSSGALNPIRQLATVTTTVTNKWTGVSSEGVTAAFADEATEATDASPDLAQPAVDVEKAHAFIPFSIEVGQDYSGLQQELAKLLADARDVLEATAFVSGSGTAPNPEGLVTGGTVTVATAGTASLAVGDVYSLQQALGPRYQPGASWLASNTLSNTIHRLVAKGDTTDAALMSDDRRSILGKPLHEVSTLDQTTTSGKHPLVYGDIAAAYRIVDRIGLTVELIPHLFGTASNYPTGQRGLYAYWRTGATVQVPNAVRVLEVT